MIRQRWWMVFGMIGAGAFLATLESDSVQAATGTGQASGVATNPISISLALGTAIAIDVLDDGDLPGNEDPNGCDGAGPLGTFSSDPATVDTFDWGTVDALCTINSGPHVNGQCCVNNEGGVSGATLVMTLHATPTFSGWGTGCTVQIYKVDADTDIADTDVRFSPTDTGALADADWTVYNTQSGIPEGAAARVNLRNGAVDAASTVTNGTTYSHQVAVQFDDGWATATTFDVDIYYQVDCS